MQTVEITIFIVSYLFLLLVLIYFVYIIQGHKRRLSELRTFMFAVIHDLRSPLNSILGIVELNKLQGDTNDNIKLIEGRCHKMMDMMNELGEILHVEDGRREKKPIIFKDLIEEIYVKMEDNPGFREVKVITEVNQTKDFISDKSLLTSILQNLIDNAFKYRKIDAPNNFIKVSIADEKSNIKVQVSDNGIGIPQEAERKIYAPFFRVTQQSFGSGLGLYIVKRAVKQLRGTIQMESKEGVGTTFILYLPRV